MREIRLLITGRVQGIFFRVGTKETADQLGITGTVVNLSDGSVEVIAQGSEEQLENLIAYCHKGPVLAKVEQVVKEEREIKEKFSDFTILY